MSKITTERRKAWKWFSRYIRKKAANFQGYARCVTCDKKDHWKNLHAGHFIHGKTKMTYFEETNVHPQCAGCNTYRGGRLRDYTLFMIDTYGRDEVERLEELSRSNENWKITDLRELTEKYKSKFKQLDEENTI